MRLKRSLLLAPNQQTHGAHYHVISRLVLRSFLFKSEEKEMFRLIMRQVEAFSGVQVQAYCLMSNHVHLLVHVPAKDKEELSDEVFLSRLSHLYKEDFLADIRSRLENIREMEGATETTIEEMVRELKTPFLKRMSDLSEFVRAIKQRFTQWYNRTHNNTGTIWEGRFKSVLVQGGYAAQLTAAYIDLNPVRAGMVNDPKDYRWCSYAEAIAGGREAQRGLTSIMQRIDKGIFEDTNTKMNWTSSSQSYRMMLAEEGKATDPDAPLQLGESKSQRHKKTKGFSRSKASSIIENKGKLPLHQLLRCKVRYFTDGVVLGSRDYVDQFFHQLKNDSGGYEKRETGARTMKGFNPSSTDSKIYCMRALRKDLIT